jgi:hypothetical protein
MAGGRGLLLEAWSADLMGMMGFHRTLYIKMGLSRKFSVLRNFCQLFITRDLKFCKVKRQHGQQYSYLRRGLLDDVY